MATEYSFVLARNTELISSERVEQYFESFLDGYEPVFTFGKCYAQKYRDWDTAQTEVLTGSIMGAWDLEDIYIKKV